MSIKSVLATPIRWGRAKAKVLAAKLLGMFRSHKVRVVITEKKVPEQEPSSSRLYASKSVSERNTQPSHDAVVKPHVRPKAQSSHDAKPRAAKKKRSSQAPVYRNNHIKMPADVKDVKDLKKHFSPDQPIFKAVVNTAYKNINQGLMFDYHAEITSDAYDKSVPLEVLFAKFMVDLEKLADNHKSFIQRHEGINAAKFSDESHGVPEAAKAKAIKVDTLNTEGDLVTSALSWLGDNQEVRVNLEDRLDDILSQAEVQREIAFGQKAKNVARMMHAAALSQNVEELVDFAGVMENKQLEFFSEDLMTEFRIRLFQKDVIRILEANNASSEMMQAAKRGDFGRLSGLLKRDPSKLPPYIMHRLVKVIPGMAEAYHNHHVNYEPVVEVERASAPAKPVNPPAQFTLQLAQNMHALVCESVSAKQISESMKVPGDNSLGYDGVGAYTTMCNGLSHGDMFFVKAGMNYLIHDQHYPIVPPQIHQAVRYNEMKAQTIQHMRDLAHSSRHLPQVPQMLNDAIEALNNDHWEGLIDTAGAFQQATGWSLFSEYQVEQMESCSREVQPYNQDFKKYKDV